MSLLVTARSFITARTKTTASEFGTGSSSYVDATGFTGSVVPDLSAVGFKATCKDTNDVGKVRDISIGGGIINGDVSVVSSTAFKLFGNAQARNNSGSSQTMKLQLHSTSFVCTVQANSYISVNAPLTNITDWQIKASVDKIRLFTCKVDSGLLGIESSFENDTDFIESDVNGVVNAFIHSQNDGQTLWDWTGNSIEVIP